MAQEKNRGDIVTGFSIGPSFANFMNSGAPHKINIFGSDEYPLPITGDITNAVAYTDYQTSLFKDIFVGISVGIQIEYFLTNNLSIHSGIFYEEKGIDLNYYNTRDGYLEGISGEISEVYERNIINKYVIAPFLLRKYLIERNKIFVEGGIYTGYLISSEITILDEKTVIRETGFLFASYGFDNEKDTEREFTNRFDLGFVIGTGFIKNISPELVFTAEMRIGFGMRKLDAKFNNEYEVTEIPISSGYNQLLRSTNYYGLNSDSKNLNFVLAIGLGYHIGK